MDENSSSNSKQIESVIASFRNFSPEKPIENAVIYYCESHTNNLDSRAQHQATIELMYKEFDMHTCEKHELRTGYLSRYNYLPKPINECSSEEIEEAIIKGKQEQETWINRCNPDLPGFVPEDWQDSISQKENIYFKACKQLIVNKIQKNKELEDSFLATVNDYVNRHESNIINGREYVLEELSWMLSLPLLHLNKPIYLIHVGAMSNAIGGLFAHFTNLQKAARWLAPRFRTAVFENEYDFLMDYRNGTHAGYSYAIENKDLVRPITMFKREYNSTKEELSLALSREVNEKNMLLSIIEKLPGHVYWFNRDNIYLGCNEPQAKSLGLNSRHDIFGKTSKQFYSPKDAAIIDKNNTEVMETGIPYEGEENSVDGISYLTQKTPLYNNNGKVIGLLGISIDITDRKRAEKLERERELMEAEEALRAKLLKVMHKKVQKVAQTIMKNIAHDIVYPLDNLITMIHCFCENMGKEKLELMDKNLNLILAAYERNRFYSYKTHIGKHYKTQIHRIQQSFCGTQMPD